MLLSTLTQAPLTTSVDGKERKRKRRKEERDKINNNMLTIKSTRCYRGIPILLLITAAAASFVISKVSSFALFAPIILNGKHSNNNYVLTPPSTGSLNNKIVTLSALSALSSATTSSMATLNEETTWNFRMALSNLPTEKGKKAGVDGIFAIQAKFIEEPGYEPPQGIIQQIFEVASSSSEEVVEVATTTPEEDGVDTSLPTTTQMTIKSGRWTLSEDPNDRKDSLWIWGLFKEPLYPFLLLNFEIDRISLPGGEDDSIKPFQLYAQVNHKRGENGEVMLDLVSDINIREKESFKADPFGAANVLIDIDTSIGQLQLQAMP